MADTIDVDLIVEAISKGFEKVATDLNKMGKTGDEAGQKVTKANKNASMSFTELQSKISLGKQAYSILEGVVDATAGATLDYAMTVKDAARAMGASTEEASALVQVSNDARVEIGTLKIAFRQLNDDGISPNIENLKKLSDQYNALETPVQKAQFAAKMFGMRAGPEMQKLLELGSRAIDDMAQSARDAGQIMSEEGVQNADKYRDSVDNLNDRIEGLTIQLGNKLIPVLAQSADGLTTIISGTDNMRVVMDKTGKSMQGVYIQGILVALGLKTAEQAAADLAGGVDELRKQSQDMERQIMLENHQRFVAAEVGRVHIQVLNEQTGAYQMQLAGIPALMQAQDDLRNVTEQQTLAQQLANMESSNAQALFDMQAQAAYGLVEAQQTLAEAQANWSQSIGTDLASQLKAAVGDTDILNEALGAMDEILGTNTLTTELQSDAMAALIEEYKKTHDLDAFKEGVSRLKDEFMPLNKEVLEAQTNVENLTKKLDALNNKHITTYLDVIITQQGNIPGGGGGGSNQGGGGGGFEQQSAPMSGANQQMMSGGSSGISGGSDGVILEALTRLLSGSLGQQLNRNRRGGQGLYGGT